MQYTGNNNQLICYLLRKVVVTMADGQCMYGTLREILPESDEILLDDIKYPLNSVSDIEMTGSIDYHTYAEEPGKACEIDGLYFGLDAFIPNTDYSNILFGEFTCLAACHLHFSEGQIGAKDVRILSFSHKICPFTKAKSPCLYPHLYALRDGSILVGTLQDAEEPMVQTPSGHLRAINFDNVLDIIRIPLTNEFVEITLKNGTVVSGTVSAANDSMIILFGGSAAQSVKLLDVATIRYRGKVTLGAYRSKKQVKLSLGKDEEFLCKIPYFRSPEDAAAAMDGATATFLPGVTDNGLIAKDVVIEDARSTFEEERHVTGIILVPPAPLMGRPIGYIGQEFVAPSYASLKHIDEKPKGDSSFTTEQLTFDTIPQNIYVVNYVCTEKKPPYTARNITLKESYPIADYAKIWIDESGAIRKLPLSALFLDRFLNRTVEVELENGQRVSGILSSANEEELCFTDGTSVKMEHVLRVFYFAAVTDYNPDSGTGHINKFYWFHVNDFTDKGQILYLDVGTSVKFSLEARPKGNGLGATYIEITDSAPKKGYVLKYNAQQQRGSLIPPDLLEERLASKSRPWDIVFRDSDIRNPNDFKIDINRFYYLVTYTEGKDDKTAYNVRFLEAIPYEAKPASDAASDSLTPFENTVPECASGETVYLQLSDGLGYCGIYAEENDDAYLFSDGKTVVKATVEKRFRFGVVTALDQVRGTATLNNICEFSLHVAEPKMVSILKNQKNRVRLHVMYTCSEGKITEVCRISQDCLKCLPWKAGVVTKCDGKAHSIMIDSSITHYLTVMSEGVNSYVNNGTILNRAVFAKQVLHPYLVKGGITPNIVAMAIDVRCQEEELKIQYDDGKDLYFGYRNATIFFPVFGSSAFLEQKIGRTIPVAFRVGNDMTTLEGYAEGDVDEASQNAEPIEEWHSSEIQKEPLCLLLLQKEETEPTLLREDGSLPDQSQVQRAVDTLMSKSKRLAAVKLAMEYPEYELSVKTANLLQSEMRARCTNISQDANLCYGEQAYYLSTLLRYPAKSKDYKRDKYTRDDCLYRLFSQDFGSREDLARFMQENRPATRENLVGLFRKQCLQVDELVAHLVLLDKVSLDTVSRIICGNTPLADAVMAYAKESDDMISGDNISEVIRALQDRYQHDKKRFSGRVTELNRTENVCEKLKDILTAMQSRFLKLICRDDRLRFERLIKICADVLDYPNRPGFSQQEQLLQNAYREIGLLEEEILAHPCKESAEILLDAEQGEFSSNILSSVKQNIFALLNRLYQDASAPRIQCKVNEVTIRPDTSTIWLLIENGGKNDDLQPAENLRIELESFTDGFMLQKQVRMTKDKLSCGEQLAAEVEIELSDDMSGVLEFDWVAKYNYTVAFREDGTTETKSFSLESEQPLQLQIDAAPAYSKNYEAINPYAGPARGEPLTRKDMFFGREKEKKDILNCICTDEGEKQFVPGRAVIIHGQKKCGKTSLVNQIKNYITEDEELADKAILLNFANILDDTGGVEILHRFKRNFYSMIMRRFQDEIFDNHPDIAESMDEAGLEIPNLLSAENADIWAAQFDKFFLDFSKLDAGKHQIILFMDEFTILCITILEEIQRSPDRESLTKIPNFIKTFSQYGFIQVIIGHEAMMRALDTLGVRNHTAEFAKSIEISALDEAASRALVIQPMLTKFGYNVYGSELGDQAVERLLDLSGRNPTYLMRLCDKMFRYYTDPEKCPGTQLLLSDVNAMVQEYIGELSLPDFDVLLREDGDDPGELESRITYQYLRSAAQLSLASYDKRTADSGEITRELSREPFRYSPAEIEKTRNILEARRVISIEAGGRVKINTGLFSEYILQKNGLK